MQVPSSSKAEHKPVKLGVPSSSLGWAAIFLEAPAGGPSGHLLYLYYDIIYLREGVIDMQKGTIYWIALILLIIGGLSWGLIGIFQWDIITAIFGDMTTIGRIIYTLVGVSAIYILIAAFSSKE